MKIVIDIPEEYYDLLKNFDDKKCSIDMLFIKHGTPYEERKTGKWEVYANGFANLLKCQCCAGFVNITDECHIPYYAKNFLYCPYCGAKMEVGDAE